MTPLPAPKRGRSDEARAGRESGDEAGKRARTADDEATASDSAGATAAGPAPQGWGELDRALAMFVDEFLPASAIRGEPPGEGEWIAVFSFGTTVRVRLPDDAAEEGWVFDPKNDDEYPTHRFSTRKDLEGAWADAVQTLERTVSDHPDHADAVRAAYQKLVDAGYPLPGGEGADFVALPMASAGDARRAREWKAAQGDAEGAAGATRTGEGGDEGSAGEGGERDEEEKAGEEESSPAGPFLWGATEGGEILSLALTEGRTFVDFREASEFGKETRRYDYIAPRVVAIVGHDLAVHRL